MKKFTIMFDDAPEDCPTGFAIFESLDDLIQSKHFPNLNSADKILRRNHSAKVLFGGKSGFEDITEAVCEYYYAIWCGFTLHDADNWSEQMQEWAEKSGAYEEWEAVNCAPDGDTDRDEPDEIRYTSHECNVLIRESKVAKLYAAKNWRMRPRS